MTSPIPPVIQVTLCMSSNRTCMCTSTQVSSAPIGLGNSMNTMLPSTNIIIATITIAMGLSEHWTAVRKVLWKPLAAKRHRHPPEWTSHGHAGPAVTTCDSLNSTTNWSPTGPRDPENQLLINYRDSKRLFRQQQRASEKKLNCDQMAELQKARDLDLWQ